MLSGWSPTFEALIPFHLLPGLLGFAYITDSPCSIDRVGVRLVFTTLPSGCHFQVGENWIISSTTATFKVPDGTLIEDVLVVQHKSHF